MSRTGASFGALADAVQAATGDHVELAYVDQGYTGAQPAADAAAHGIELTVVKLPESSGASCCCRAGGWWSGASPGWRGSGGWPGTTSAWPRRWPGSISWRSPASCS